MALKSGTFQNGPEGHFARLNFSVSSFPTPVKLQLSGYMQKFQAFTTTSFAAVGQIAMDHRSGTLSVHSAAAIAAKRMDIKQSELNTNANQNSKLRRSADFNSDHPQTELQYGYRVGGTR